MKLLEAVFSQNYNEVERILTEETDVNQMVEYNEMNITPMFAAIKNLDFFLIKKLVDNKANLKKVYRINERYFSAIDAFLLHCKNKKFDFDDKKAEILVYFFSKNLPLPVLDQFNLRFQEEDETQALELRAMFFFESLLRDEEPERTKLFLETSPYPMTEHHFNRYLSAAYLRVYFGYSSRSFLDRDEFKACVNKLNKILGWHMIGIELEKELSMHLARPVPRANAQEEKSLHERITSLEKQVHDEQTRRNAMEKRLVMLESLITNTDAKKIATGGFFASN